MVLDRLFLRVTAEPEKWHISFLFWYNTKGINTNTVYACVHTNLPVLCSVVFSVCLANGWFLISICSSSDGVLHLVSQIQVYNSSYYFFKVL